MATIEEIPDDPVVDQADSDDDAAFGREGKANRNEKKARKALSKLGLKPFPGVSRVAIKKGNNMLFVIASPDVLRVPNSDTFIVFGEANMEDPTQNKAANAARQFEQASAEERASMAAAAGIELPTELGGVSSDDGADVDTTGLEEKDIELVMQQGNVSRGKAAQVLRANNGDVVNAIMELTT